AQISPYPHRSTAAAIASSALAYAYLHSGITTSTTPRHTSTPPSILHPLRSPSSSPLSSSGHPSFLLPKHKSHNDRLPACADRRHHDISQHRRSAPATQRSQKLQRGKKPTTCRLRISRPLTS